MVVPRQRRKSCVVTGLQRAAKVTVHHATVTGAAQEDGVCGDSGILCLASCTSLHSTQFSLVQPGEEKAS